MRIIGGSHKGRTIRVASNLPTRPTTDMAREALFNILMHNYELEDIDVLDLCAGTGAIAFEFASRGAKKVIAVDRHNRCIRSMDDNLKYFEFDNISVKKQDYLYFMKHCTIQFDIIFADPPYDLEGVSNIPDQVFENEILKPKGLFILEHSDRISFSGHENIIDSRNYGKVNFSFFQLT